MTTFLTILLGVLVIAAGLWIVYKLLVFLLKVLMVAAFIAALIAGGFYLMKHPLPSIPLFDTQTQIDNIQKSIKQRQAILELIEEY